MPKYVYEAVTTLGKRVKGNLEADDSSKAVAKLTATGHTVISIKEAGFLNAEINISLGGKKVAPRDMGAYCHQFVAILKAGVPLVTCLKMMEKQSQNKVLAATTREIRISVEKGATLAAAMAKHDAVFPPLFVNMVRSGEETGNIDKSFEQMAVQYEKDAKMKGIVKKAMMYPLVVCCLAVVLVVVMLVWIVPQFTSMFSEMDLTMPAYTLAIVAMSDFLKENWYFVLGGVLILVALFRVFRATDKGKHILGNIAISMPIFGKLNVKTACAQFSRNLQTMLSAGIKITDALDIVAQTMNSLIYSESVYEIKKQVEMGLPLQRALEKTGLYPPMVTNMVGIGEEAGSTEEMLGTVADYYELEVEETTQQVAATLEPLLIIAMALICVAIIGGVFLPIISLYGQLETL